MMNSMMPAKSWNNKFLKKRSHILTKERQSSMESLRNSEILQRSLSKRIRSLRRKLLLSSSQRESQRRMTRRKSRRSQQMLATSRAKKVSQNFGQKL
jgi:ribosomal protein L35